MQLLSPDFRSGSEIPIEFTCDGENYSPEFEITGVPAGATCLAFIMDDPDAPKGTFVHWIFWNASFKTTKFSSRALPNSAVEGENDAKKLGYIGPCPPSGTHRYFFKIYALNTSLKLEQGVTKDKLMEAMQEHIIAETELVGLYSKNNSS